MVLHVAASFLVFLFNSNRICALRRQSSFCLSIVIAAYIMCESYVFGPCFETEKYCPASQG